jgi:hypothetical protein
VPPRAPHEAKTPPKRTANSRFLRFMKNNMNTTVSGRTWKRS